MTSPVQRAPLRIIFKEGVLQNNYPDLDTLTHGWRWYLVDNDNRGQAQLVSPMVGRVPLPRNGFLDNAYFIPKAELMLHALNGSWRELTPEMIRERGYALTFGRITGPFERDLNISQVFGAMKCATYQALAICTDTPQRFVGAYDLPMVRGTDLSTLRAVERAWGGASAGLSPLAQVRSAAEVNPARQVAVAAVDVLARRGDGPVTRDDHAHVRAVELGRTAAHP